MDQAKSGVEGMSPSPADVLRGAANRVRRGWTRGRFTDEDGNACSVGAINLEAASQLMATGLPWGVAHDRALPLAREALEGLHRSLESVLGREIWCVANWNDHVAEDAEDVAQMMEKAAARWEELYG